jgi:pyridoxamine 5'-phosphate oxidase
MGDITERTPRLSLAGLRENYACSGLSEADCHTNPIRQFERWFLEAQAADLKEPNAMTLSTVGADGRPSARVVLLKDVSDDGFVFYTNYLSRKGRDFRTNPFAALTLYWAELERQVRIEGRIGFVSREESEAYFRSRPRGSRIGAWVSKQSEDLTSREELEAKLKEVEARFAGTDDIPLPDYWGGYRVHPDSIEFWQGRENRLHDRIRYRREGDGPWTMERLWP